MPQPKVKRLMGPKEAAEAPTPKKPRFKFVVGGDAAPAAEADAALAAEAAPVEAEAPVEADAAPVEAAAAAASPPANVTWAYDPLTGGIVDAPAKRKAEDDLAEDAHPRGLKKPKAGED